MKRNFILFVSVLGILFSILTIHSHYATDEGFCIVGGECDIVNKSKYSEFLGIPLGVFGILWFLSYNLSNETGRKYLSLAGVLGVIYLVYIELAVLQAICSTCTIIHILILILAARSLLFHKSS